MPAKALAVQVLAFMNRLLRWTVALLVVVAALYVWNRNGTVTAPTPAGLGAAATVAASAAAIPVTVAKVQKADFAVYLYGLGTVEPYKTVSLHSRVDGQIVKVSFKQGQLVKEGDPLIEIDKRAYQAALDQAVAKKQLDQALLDNTTKDLDRLVNAGNLASTQQQIDTQRSLVAQQQAQVNADDAVIASAQTQLSYTSITAPISGKMGFRSIDPGNIVHAADANGIATIVQLQPISVVFTAPEEQIPAINAALVADQVTVDALSSDGTRVLSRGHLALIDNAVTESSGSIGMKASFANADQALWPGLSVSTNTLLETLKDVMVVPDAAVQHGPDGLFSFVVGGDNKVAMQPIKVSNTGNGKAVVTGGLSEGQTVVVAGQYRLVTGSVVQATAATSEAN
jgi:membrane fusion protein, multidrug efflux system